MVPWPYVSVHTAERPSSVAVTLPALDLYHVAVYICVIVKRRRAESRRASDPTSCRCAVAWTLPFPLTTILQAFHTPNHHPFPVRPKSRPVMLTTFQLSDGHNIIPAAVHTTV